MWKFFELFNDEDGLLTILDIGAAMTGAPTYQPLLDAGRARLIGFEPDCASCEKLNEFYGAPHQIFPFFVGDGKPATYFETNWGLTGSLYKPNTPLLDKFQLLSELTVPVARGGPVP